jgi:hypothetical protein
MPNSTEDDPYDWTVVETPELIDGPQPVYIFGGLSRARFFEVLNGDRDFPQTTFKPSSEAAVGNVIRSRSGAILASAQLRLYVDEWLETGRERDGSEDARARDLTRAPNACEAIERFNSKPQLRLKPDPKGLGLEFPYEWRQDGPALADWPVATADRFFSLFQLAECRLKLAKCRTCGCYFELKHWKRRYKRGTLCSECQRGRSLESAAGITLMVREAAQKELYRLAARRFGTRLAKPDCQRDQQLKATIVDFLNDRIKKTDGLRSVYLHGVTTKWLSWSKNWKGIEEAAKGKTHAQG